MSTNNSNLDLVIVMPVAAMDWHLAVKFLKWCRVMESRAPNAMRVDKKFMILCSPALDATHRLKLLHAVPPSALAHVDAAHIEESGYFGSANRMFLAALQAMEQKFPGHAMLWVEADCVPMRSNWFELIRDEYRSCGQPFMGDHVLDGAFPYMTGNGVYHPDWRRLAPSLADIAAYDAAWGWDSKCAPQVFRQSHRAKTIQQIWRPVLPMTSTAGINAETALFHQCKDGTLIDVLAGEKIPMDAALAESTYEKERHLHGGEHNRSKTHKRIKVNPVTEILIVTFKRDMEFLKLCLQSIEKYAVGFGNVTVLVPSTERGLYEWASKWRIQYFEETPGKGMMSHELEVIRADRWCEGADIIAVLDADCLFWRTTTPNDLAPQGKPIIVREHYDKVGNPNRHLWRDCVDRAIGIRPDYEMMVCKPPIFHRETFSKTRELIEATTGRRYETFIMSQRSEWPQEFAEFPTLSTVALNYFKDEYTWVDYDKAADKARFGINNDNFQYIYDPLRDFVVEGWSHDFNRYHADWKQFLNGNNPQFYIK